MTILADVEARLDERSLKSASDLFERSFADSGRRSSESFTREMSGGLRGLTGLVNEFGRGLRDGMDSHLRGLSGSFDGVSSKVSGIGTAGLAAVGGIAAMGTAAAVVGKALYDLGAQWDSISDGITIRTGKVGSELKSLTDVVGDVGSTTAASLGSIGDIVGQLSQSMPGLTENSGAIREMASNLAFLAENGQAVNIRELGNAFKAFNVNAADQVETLDQLAQVSRTSQIPLNELISSVQSGAAQFKQFGLTMGESVGLMASFEAAGLDPSKAVTGLAIALKQLGSDARGAGPALADAVTQIKAFYDANDLGSAKQLAQDTFGAKTFAPFLDAIESGQLSVESLNKSLEGTGLSLQQMQDDTDDGAQGFTKLKNTASDALKPLGDWIFSNANQPLLLMQENLEKAGDGLKSLASTKIEPGSALAQMLLPGGGAPGGGHPLDTGLGSGFGPITAIDPDKLSWGPQGGFFANPGASTRTGSAKAADPAQVPYDTSLPPGFANLPQTAAIYSAQTGYMDANTAYETAQARLNQLKADNTATAADIQKAENDVVTSEHSRQSAELRLQEARQSLYDKDLKQLQGHADALGQVGAQLDQDFGISEGLPGIAKNLTMFLGNLIAAPAMAQLNAISNAPGQAQGGFGLIGMLGAQGAFGPQYTAEGQAAASAQTSASTATRATGATGGAYGSDAALLANVPSGSYAWGGGDLSKGLTDCSGAVTDLVNILDTGSATAGHDASTLDEAQWLTQRGFLPTNTPMPGTFQVGLNAEHTQATLPGGTNFNWGNDTDAANRGVAPGSGGAWMPGFTQHFYRPVGAGGMPATDLPMPATGVTPSTSTGGGGGYGAQSLPIPLPVTIVGGFTGGGGVFGAPALGLPGDAPVGTPASGQGLGPAPGPAPLGTPDVGGIGGGGGPGMGMPQGAPLGARGIGPGMNFGPGAGPTQIGAAVSPASGSGQGGIGIAPGGSLDTALGLAASAFPGMGQAAQTGMKLASRAIQFGGQAAAIGVQGLMDTVLPTGGSDLANHSWFSKILGGLAGAAPALPNMAGKTAAAAGKDGQQGQQQMGPGMGGDTHINVTEDPNRGADGTGKDIAWHQQQQQLPAGKP